MDQQLEDRTEPRDDDKQAHDAPPSPQNGGQIREDKQTSPPDAVDNEQDGDARDDDPEWTNDDEANDAPPSPNGGQTRKEPVSSQPNYGLLDDQGEDTASQPTRRSARVRRPNPRFEDAADSADLDDGPEPEPSARQKPNRPNAKPRPRAGARRLNKRN